MPVQASIGGVTDVQRHVCRAAAGAARRTGASGYAHAGAHPVQELRDPATARRYALSHSVPRDWMDSTGWPRPRRPP